MTTRAVRDGDEWVITGTKNWISNLGDRRLLRRVRGHRPRARRLSAFVVEADRPGFSVGKLEHKLGIRGSPTGQPIFDDVRIPAENLIGTEGKGLSVALSTLDHSRLGVAAQALGIAQGATDYAVAYAKERRQFGQPIASFQGMQFKLADMETRTAAARELLYKACAKADRGERDLGKYSAMAKLFASDTAMAVTVEAVQVLGGYGYVSEYPVERMMRDAKITQIYEGTNEIQRRRDREGAVNDPQRILLAAAVALSAGLAVIAALAGFSDSTPIRLIQGAAFLVLLIFGIGGAMGAVGVRMAGWQEPESEEEFERVVERAERLAREGTAAEPDEMEFADLDPLDDEDFEELVREALDELPDLLQRALGRNVAVVISDGGRRHRAYGLYHGDGVARDDIPDRIIIFRDTLRRDFGHDPDLLREQVTITVRHELAHHLGRRRARRPRARPLVREAPGRRRGRNAATIRRRRSADARRSRASASIAPTPRRCHSSATANVTSDVPSPPGAYCATPAKRPVAGIDGRERHAPVEAQRACLRAEALRGGTRRRADTGRTTRRGFVASGMAMPPARSGCAATGSARPRRGWSRPCGSPGCAAGRGPARCRAA